jgi:hypothetical protein
LAKAVARLLEFEDQVTIRLKTCWLTHIYVFIMTKEGINESSCDISLGRNEFSASSQHHHRADIEP